MTVTDVPFVTEGVMTCVVCGTQKVAKDHLKRKYCSRRCSGLGTRGPKSPRSTDPMYFVICTGCGVEKHFEKAQAGRKYCSVSCGSKNQSRPRTPGKPLSYLTAREPGHPLANPITGLIRIHRKVLFEKVGPEPQSCHWCGRVVEWFGKGPKRLATDHLDDNRRNNDPANLVASCVRCNAHRARQGGDFVNRCRFGHERRLGTTCATCRQKWNTDAYARRRASRAGRGQS